MPSAPTPNLCPLKSSADLRKWCPHPPCYSDDTLWHHPRLLFISTPVQSLSKPCSVFSASARLQTPPFLALTHVRASCPPVTLASLSLIARGEITSPVCSGPCSGSSPSQRRPTVLTVAYEAVPDLLYKAAPLSLRVPLHLPSMHTYGCVCTHTLSFSLCCSMSFLRGDILLFAYL